MEPSRILLIILAFPNSVGAVQIASDPFDTGGDSASGEHVEGAVNLIGQRAVITGFTGSWLPANSGAQSPDVQGTGLSYPGLASPMRPACRLVHKMHWSTCSSTESISPT